MPKKSTKSKSKRTTLKQKYKLIKKVKEHNQKKRREDARNKRLGCFKSRAPRDPGVPAEWPYKEELMKEIDFELDKKKALDKAKTQARHSRRSENRERAGHNPGGNMHSSNFEDLHRKASDAAQEFQLKKAANFNVNGTAAKTEDNGGRAYFKEFVKVVEASDVIIQVLDARDPLAYRSPEVEQFVRRVNPDKRVVLMLNKIDLVPKDNVQKWLKYFREEIPCVAFKCATGKKSDGGKLGSGELHFDYGSVAHASLGAETLLQLLKNYARNRKMKTSITVGIVGFPNVGKSSLINALKRNRSAASTGNTPGLTKVSKEVMLDKQIKLIDSPGVIFASCLGETAGAATLRNCVRVEQLEDPVSPVCEILRRCPNEQLMLIYKMGHFEHVDDFLMQLGRKKGLLKRGGVPDMMAAARVVVGDWNSGRIPYYTNPPVRSMEADEEHVSAEVVTKWNAEFDVDKLFAKEDSTMLAGLTMADSDKTGFLPSLSAGNAVVDEDLYSVWARQKSELLSIHGLKRVRDKSGTVDSFDETAYHQASAKMSMPVAQKLTPQVQSVNLYEADGQLNPNLTRTSKKSAKKLKTRVLSASKGGVEQDGSGSDFEWEDSRE
tara:strand:- start:60 stop:1880 length:1821 start_codon:yes stop_codon:yes gene_type:complete